MADNGTDEVKLDGAAAIPKEGPYAWTLGQLQHQVAEAVTRNEFRMWGFFGAWGSGKTTMLDELHRRVADKYKAPNKHAEFESFDAWDARQDPNLPLAILAHLIEPDPSKNWLDALDSPRFRHVGAVLITAVSGVTRFFNRGGLAELANDHKVSRETAWGSLLPLQEHAEGRVARAQLNAALSGAEGALLEKRGISKAGRLVVAIDNLDRCSPFQLVEVLESLHNFDGLRKIRFLLVGDEDALVEGIRSRYPTLKAEGARAYLEKIVSPVLRMPDLSEDENGLKKILYALGLKDSIAACKKASQLEPSEQFLVDVCRFVFHGNPRKALHMFRSLPAYIGQWNYGTRHAYAVRGGSVGLVLRWVLTEYCSSWYDALFAVAHREDVKGTHVELREDINNVTREAAEFVMRIRRDSASSGVNALAGSDSQMGATTLLIGRAQFKNDQNGATEWGRTLKWLFER